MGGRLGGGDMSRLEESFETVTCAKFRIGDTCLPLPSVTDPDERPLPTMPGRGDSPMAKAKRPPIHVPSVTAAVTAALATYSHCVPHGAVMLSMATTHMRRLRPYQFYQVAGLQCFMDRFVSLTYGFTDTYGTCVYGNCSRSMGKANPCIPSDYRRSQYVSLNWAKWPLFISALKVARAALWLEADVLILVNPWESLLLEAQRGPTRDHAIRYQWENLPCATPDEIGTSAVGCRTSGPNHPEPLNCGQLLLTSLAFAESVWAARPPVFQNGALSQQHYANVARANITPSGAYSGLPATFFNHCWLEHKGAKINDFCALVTYHATCSARSKDKRFAMEKVVTRFFRQCKAHPANSTHVARVDLALYGR